MNEEIVMPERVRMSDFLAHRFTWEQGEHITVVGPTDYGKTTLVIVLLEERDYVVFFATKPRDETISALEGQGYYFTRDWPAPMIVDPDTSSDNAPGRVHPFLKPLGRHTPEDTPTPEIRMIPQPRVLLWPEASSLRSAELIQRDVFMRALDDIYTAGGYAIFIDETHHAIKKLGMGDDLETYWQQARSLGISVVAAAQRPRSIPLFAYDQATHLFLGHNADAASQKRLGEISGGVDGSVIARIVANVPKHWWLYVDQRDGTMMLINTRY